MAFSVLVPVGVSAACQTNTSAGIAKGASDTGTNVSCENEGQTQNKLGDLAKNIVNLFSFIVGAVAVIMIIYGGFRYITSGGGAESVGSAKKTLIYAIIGLIIVALAQIIVQFVLSQTNSAI